MARSISVKIPTATIITMVEDKVSQLKTEIAEYPARLAQYKADRKKYVADVAVIVADLISSGKQELFEGEYDNIIRIGRSYNGGVELAVGKNLVGDLHEQAPKEPENPSGYNGVNSKLKELEKTLTLLRLTPQETVTSSTYNSVLELL